MVAFVPLVSVASLLFGGVVLAVLLVGVWYAVSGSSWDTPRSTAGESEDVVCPRCHHRTPPQATDCPECGKSL